MRFPRVLGIVVAAAVVAFTVACHSVPPSGSDRASRLGEVPVRAEPGTWSGIERVTCRNTGRFVGTAWYVGGGLFVTAAHVPEGLEGVRVAGLRAAVTYSDRDTDVAVLSASGYVGPSLKVGGHREVGTEVFAPGYTGRGGWNLQTQGHLSSHDVMGWWGYNGGVASGMSGSPLVCMDTGEVVGIVVAAGLWVTGSPNSSVVLVSPYDNVLAAIAAARESR